ncbi:hypothetical protein F4819DRAFT_426188 [Hypoxylon fuscum]|nr:hypothetical protein F4819DRAFT_426188 [Hypoxylon fuscum]
MTNEKMAWFELRHPVHLDTTARPLPPLLGFHRRVQFSSFRHCLSLISCFDGFTFTYLLQLLVSIKHISRILCQTTRHYKSAFAVPPVPFTARGLLLNLNLTSTIYYRLTLTLTPHSAYIYDNRYISAMLEQSTNITSRIKVQKAQPGFLSPCRGSNPGLRKPRRRPSSQKFYCYDGLYVTCFVLMPW